MKLTVLVTCLASTACAHTTFTTLFIDGRNQGDGTCVRMPFDPGEATFPIRPITSTDMVCGKNGTHPVNFVCNASKGSTLTFEFRIWPDGQRPGSIDPGHIGPCAVYVKKVNDMFTSKAEGGGWFKIWEDGFDRDTQKWCVDKLVANNGLLSVRLPEGLPSGYYLVRPEILALHWARKGDPQYFLGCAQVFLDTDVQKELRVPDEHIATIPGYFEMGRDPGVTFNPYQNDVPPYPIPGPKVFIPEAQDKSRSLDTTARLVQSAGLIPKNCVLKNANWCAKPISPYSEENGCWTAVNNCYAQSKECRKSAPPIGSRNCDQWSDYCESINGLCGSGNFEGPPVFGKKEKYMALPGELPGVFNDVFERRAGEAAERAWTAAPGETLEKPSKRNMVTLVKKNDDNLPTDV